MGAETHAVDAEAFEEAFLTDYEKLEPKRKELVQLWFGWQREVALAAGLTLDAWFDLVTWAGNHPFDFSFIEDFPEPDAVALAEAENPQKRVLLAQEAPQKKAIPTGEGVLTKARSPGLEGELYRRWMSSALAAQGAAGRPPRRALAAPARTRASRVSR